MSGPRGPLQTRVIWERPVWITAILNAMRHDLAAARRRWAGPATEESNTAIGDTMEDRP